MLTDNRSLNKLFNNNQNLSIMFTRIIQQPIQKKNENPLFPIARDKRKAQFYTYDFPFLEDSEGNENTYILGFCAGVSHATEIMQKQISELQAKVREMEAKGVVEESPTIHRQNS